MKKAYNGALCSIWLAKVKAVCVAVFGGWKRGKSGGKIVLKSEADFEKNLFLNIPSNTPRHSVPIIMKTLVMEKESPDDKFGRIVYTV